MKRCPQCNREYADDSLRFCLEDGASLIAARTSVEPPPTEILPARLRQTEKSSEPTILAYPGTMGTRSPQVDSRRSNPILVAGVIAIVLLLIVLVAIAAIYVIQHSGPTNSNQTNVESPSPRRPTPQPTKAGSDEATPTPFLNSGPLQITASASSVRLAVQANTYYAGNAIDGKSSTAWIDGVAGPGVGEWIRFDFDREINLHRILIQPGYFKGPQVWSQNNRLAKVTMQFSDGSSRVLTLDDRMESQRFDVGSVKTRWVRLVIGSVYEGTDPGPNDDTALSEIAFEWEP
jgi:hypothetical protein